MRPRPPRNLTGPVLSLRCRAALLAGCLAVAGLGAALPLAAAAQPAAAAGRAAERGFPLIRTFIPEAKEAGIQNFGIAADPRGVLYVANLSGVLVYDGAWWQVIEIGEAATAFAVGTDAAGRVAAGGFDDLGYLRRDARGRRVYASLLDRLPEDLRHLGQVTSVHPAAGGFVFLTNDRLLAWNGDEGEGSAVRTVATFPGDWPFASTYRVGDEIYAWTRQGLARLVGDDFAGLRLAPLPGGEVFAGRRVDQILPAAEAGEAVDPDHPALLVSVRTEGLFLFRRGEAEAFAPRASRWATAHRLFAGTRLPDGRWALGSIVGGLLLLAPDGRVDQVIDTGVGLADDFVNDMVVDGEGALWLALNTDLARIDVASPLTVLDRRSGLAGSVYHLARHRGDLWVATAAGLFVLDGASAELGSGDGAARPPAAVRRVEGLPPSVWYLLSVGDDLLAATAGGVYVVSPAVAAGKAAPRLVPGSEDGTAYVLAASPSDPHRAWLGSDEALVALHRDADGWRVVGRVEMPSPVRSVVESTPTVDAGEASGAAGGLAAGSVVVWCGTELDGVVGVDVGVNVGVDVGTPAEGGEVSLHLRPRPEPMAVGSDDVPGGGARGEPGQSEHEVSDPLGTSGPVTLVRPAGSDVILAAHDDRLWRLDESTGTLVADPISSDLGAHGSFYAFTVDAAGDLWLNTQPPVVVPRRPGGGWGPQARPLVELPARAVETFVPEADGTVWMGAENGLYRFAGPAPEERSRDVAATAAAAGGADAAAGSAGRSDGGAPSDARPFHDAGALPAPLISSVTSGGDHLVFAGSPDAPPPFLDLAPDVRRLRIEFAPLSFRKGVRYETRLDPVDDAWRSSGEPFVELTRLPPGRYVLRVRSVGPSSGPGPETAWSFRVKPPWYLTGWALAAALLLALAGVRGYGRLRSRALRLRAAELEERVDEQTRELQRAVDELRRTQSDLETANTRLEELSQQDELTGVANRRRLQITLEEEWSRARRHRRPIAFILIDLDHFKLLNDSRGHREGDACLKAVARYLDDEVQRTGDLLVRYGGEEFAVLLADTDRGGAQEVAERLRRGLEGLAIPHEATPAGHITASFGVASLIPGPAQRPGVLVEAADLALYRAKTEGRNQVRVYGAEDESDETEIYPH